MLPSAPKVAHTQMPLLICPTDGSGPLLNYITPMGASGLPAVFVLRTDFIAVDAFGPSSADSGNSTMMAPATGWSAKDLVQFNWSAFGPPITLIADKRLKIAAYMASASKSSKRPTPGARSPSLGGNYLAGTNEETVATLGDMTAEYPKESRPVEGLALGVTSDIIDANGTSFT